MHSDFEKRYQRPAVRRPSEKLQKDMREDSLALAHRLHKNPRRLSSLVGFEDWLTTDRRLRELKSGSRKVIGTFCYFAPEELIHAAGAWPVRLCSGHTETITPSEELLPRDICPLVKSSLGAAVVGGSWFDACHAVVLPLTCDAKTKLGEYLSDYLPVWLMNLPRVKDYASVKKAWLEEIKKLKARLEEACGVKIERANLRSAIDLLRQRSQVYRDLCEIRRLRPDLVSHSDWLMMIQSGFYADIQDWVHQARSLLQEMKMAAKGPAPAGRSPRLLLTGAPIIWPNYKVLGIIESLGASVVADELCVGHQKLWDLVEPDEWTLDGMLSALASRYLFPSTCPCFANSYDRIDKLLQMAADYNVQGVVYHDLRLCQVFDMEKDLVNKVLKERKIPMLTLHTDYGQEDVEQLRTRVEAFLEMLQ